MSLEREPHVLAQAVRNEVEVARAGSDTLRLRPLDVVLEPVEASLDPACAGEPEQVLGRLDEDGHLVAVVLAAMMEAVHGRSDRRPENRASLDQLCGIHLAPLEVHQGLWRTAWTTSAVRLRARREDATGRCGWRESNPHGRGPPVSETGASARFRHIRMRLGAGTPRARAERATSRRRESGVRLVGLTRHPAGAAARVVPTRGAPCGARPGRSPWPAARRARGAGATSRTMCRCRCISLSSLSSKGARGALRRSEGAAGEVRDQLRRRGVEAHDVEHSRIGRVCDREAVRDHADHDQPCVDARRPAVVAERLRGMNATRPGLASRCRSRTCRPSAPSPARTASAAHSRYRRTAGGTPSRTASSSRCRGVIGSGVRPSV